MAVVIVTLNRLGSPIPEPHEVDRSSRPGLTYLRLHFCPACNADTTHRCVLQAGLPRTWYTQCGSCRPLYGQSVVSVDRSG